MDRSLTRTRPIALVVLFGALAGLLLFATPAAAESVRKQIKHARKDLVGFERDLTALVESFDRLRSELDVQAKRERSLRTLLRRTDRTESLYQHALARWVIHPLVKEELAKATDRQEIIEALLPGLRNEIWTRGSERDEKIDTLDAAIELLESTRSGDLVTKSGIDGGQLITYSADWAAVAHCESTGRWHIDDYFDGGLQFLPSTWWGFGGGEYAHFAYQATRRQQIDIAERVLAVQGPNAWPNCFKALPADTDE